MAIRLMVVSDDINHTNEVKQYFKSSSKINVVSVVSSKEEVIENINECDVILLNMLLSNMDSVYILTKLDELNVNKKIIATSEFISSDLMDIINRYNVNHFIKKPYSCDSLEKIINSLFNKENESSEGMELKIEITNMLHSLGIPSHIKGYTYIRDGIEMLYRDSSLIGSITKELYPSIASNYSTTSSRVERAIRHAIEVSWNRGDYDLMEELFGNSVDYDKSKPTNSEFIATLADRLKLQNKYA